MTTISFARHQFPPDIIRHAVWLYFRFTLSFRDVEDLLGLPPIWRAKADAADEGDGYASAFPTATTRPSRWSPGGVRANSRAVPAVLASAHEQSVPIFQQLARGHPPGRDNVRAIPAFAAQRDFV